MITVVTGTKSKTKKEDGRNAVKKKAEAKNKEHMKSLEVKGKSEVDKEEGEMFNKLTDIMVNGREEMKKLRLYKICVNKLEFELRFVTARIKEIREEIKELKDERDSDDDEMISEVNKLKNELKETRQKKKDIYQHWNVKSYEPSFG